jgi:hypothetical protein
MPEIKFDFFVFIYQLVKMDDAYYQKISDALDNQGCIFLRINSYDSNIVMYRTKYGVTEFTTHIKWIFHDNRVIEFRHKN